MMNPDNEQYQCLIGGIAGRYWWGVAHWDTEGRPSGVDFDPNIVLQRENEYGDVVGFYHTHPHMSSSPSSIDYRAMGGWTVCFGRPLACLIKGVDGLKAHWFIDDETRHVTGWVKRFGRLYVGRIPQKIHRVFRKKKEKREQEVLLPKTEKVFGVTRKPGVPGRQEMYKILKTRSEELKRGVDNGE